MVDYSDDSSDSEKKLFSPKTRVSSLTQKSANNRNSGEVSTTHGVVVDRIPSKESPTKQSRKTNDSEKLKSRNFVAKSSHTFDGERPAKPNVRNIKIEKFSGSESEDAVPGSRNTVQTKKNYFYDEEDEKSKVLEAQDQTAVAYDSDDIGRVVHQGVGKASVKKNRVVVKREVISSEDEETIIRNDPHDEIIGQQKKLPGFNNSEKEAGSSSGSEHDIPPSQYWLHHYRDVKKSEDEASAPMTSPEKLSQNSDLKDSGDTKKRALGTVELSSKKESQRKSPPRITKTEIISAKYTKINQRTPETREESSNDTDSFNDSSKVPKKEDPTISQGSSNDHQRDEKVLQENENSEDNTTSETGLNTSDKMSLKTLSPSNKKQSPKKPAASPKRKLSIKAESPESKFSIKANIKKTNKVNPAKRKLNDSLSKDPLQQRENIYDKDTTSEEEEKRIERQEKALKFVLALQKPDKSSSNTGGRQATLVAKINEKFVENSKPQGASEKGQSRTSKDSIPPANNLKDDSSSEESSSDEEPKPKIQRKVSPVKKQPVRNALEEETIERRLSTASASSKKKFDSKVSLTKKKAVSSSSDKEEERKAPPGRIAAASRDQETTSSTNGSASASLKRELDSRISPMKENPDSSGSDEEEEEEREAAGNQEQEAIKNRTSSGSASSSLKRKLDSDETLSSAKTREPQNAGKAPLKKKKLESNSLEPGSNKRAKLMPPSKVPSHNMSDSDETDSLTKLNTTLNKTMALMENRSETVESKKKSSTESRKSVSINTKHKTKHVPNDTMSQKSILKKPELPYVDDNTESDSLSQEQTVEEKVQPIIAAPKIIKRPQTLRDFKKQENLSSDTTKASFGLEDLSEDDEIYILDVPRTVDPKELKGQMIRLGGKNKLQIGDQLYETCDKDAANISCVFRTGKEENSYKAANIKPAGCINVRQKLSKTSQIELIPVEKRSVPFPENLKVRHPLFGAGFEDKITNANIKVLKKASESIKKSHSFLKTKDVAKPEKRSMKTNSAERKEKKRRDPSEEFIENEIESKPKIKVGKMRPPTNETGSSDSDSDEGFFQQVKRENNGQTEDRKDFKNLSTILNLDSDPDLPTELEETVILKRPKLSAKKKLGLSVNESGIKHKSFDVNSKRDTFVSSTPIKIEKDEIPINKIRKKKNHSVS